MNLPVKDMLYGLLDSPPHPAPVAAVDRRLRRRNRVVAVMAVCSATAVTGAGIAVAQATRDNSPRPETLAASPDSPALGTIPTPDSYRKRLASRYAVPDRLDLLATYKTANATLLVAGHVLSDGQYCVTQFDDAEASTVPGGISCGPTSNFEKPGFAIGRQFSSGRGPLAYTLEGSAPAGTNSVLVSGPGHPTLHADTYDSGATWQHRAFFFVPWFPGPATVTALDAQGQPLATDSGSRG